VNILLVGAGAVGQVYARHLQLAGARVAFFVRPAAAAALAAGMWLYPLKKRHERTPVELCPAAVHTSLAAVAAEKWDQVWLCVPANALLDEGWLRSLAEAVGEATIVALPPGLDSEARIRKAFPRGTVVPALIGMISYQAPLPGETVPRPGIAYLFPPGSPSGFGGPGGRAVAELLARGGCPAVESPNVGATSAFGSCVLMPNVAADELAGWSLAGLRRGPWLPVAAAASRQAIRVAAARLGVRAPFFAFLVRGVILRIVWALVPRLLPIDVETYLRYHFTKVGAQTRQLLAEYRRDGEALGLPTGAIAKLADELAAVAPGGKGG
jgi:Ketopantoate reductase PanE/ApbA